MQKYIAEFLGTFFLAGSVVLISGTMIGAAGYGVIVAALVLGFIVYTLGPISGAHVNPAITIGTVAGQKTEGRTAVWYIIAQALAAVVLYAIVHNSVAATPAMTAWSWRPFFGEIAGSFIFIFGVAAVVFGKVDRAASGLVIGGSLLLGAITAQITGSQGVLNPAVAYASNLITSWQGAVVYIIAPIIGGKLAMMTYGYLVDAIVWRKYLDMLSFSSRKEQGGVANK